MTHLIFGEVNRSLGFGLASFSHSPSVASLSSWQQQKWDYPETERNLKKEVMVYGWVKLFEPEGLCPEIVERLLVIDHFWNNTLTLLPLW